MLLRYEPKAVLNLAWIHSVAELNKIHYVTQFRNIMQAELIKPLHKMTTFQIRSLV